MSPSSPSNRARGRVLLAATLVLLFGPVFLRAEAHLDVAGTVESISEDRIKIGVSLANRGSAPVRQVVVHGTLFGVTADADVTGEVAPGASGRVTLGFPTDNGTPGVHAVTLMLDYTSGAGASAKTFTQPAWVLIALGGQAEPAVKLFAAPARLDVAGRLEVGIESADGAAHRVELSVIAPRSLRPRPPVSMVDVPASGRVSVPLLLFRVDAPWESQQGLLLVAQDKSGPLARTTVLAGVAQIGREPGLLPRLRPTLIGLAFLLLAAAAFFETRRRRSAWPAA